MIPSQISSISDGDLPKYTSYVTAQKSSRLELADVVGPGSPPQVRTTNGWTFAPSDGEGTAGSAASRHSHSSGTLLVLTSEAEP